MSLKDFFAMIRLIFLGKRTTVVPAPPPPPPPPPPLPPPPPPPPLQVPAIKYAPAISGTLTVGSVITATTGVWDNSPTLFSYQWGRNGSIIPGAVSPSYVLANADLGALISVAVTARNAAGPSALPATSNVLTIPAPAPTPTPTPAPPPLAIILTQTSPLGTAPFTWNMQIDNTIYAGQFWRVQVATDMLFTNVVQDFSQLITESDLGGDVYFPAFVSWHGTAYLHVRAETDNGTFPPGDPSFNGTASAWALPLTDTLP